MENFQKDPHFTIHCITEDIIRYIKKNGQDNTCYGCIECDINTGQNGLHTAKCRLNRNEVNISKTPQKADKGT